MKYLVFAAAVLALAGCKDETAALPDPVTMSGDALGFYCQMNLVEHGGPKAQVHLADTVAPLFFSQVRDAIAYQRMPEQDAKVLVIYVSDMGRAHDWDNPGIDNWIPATEAHFAIGSDAIGGMGADEIVPFANRDFALSFVKRRGGRVVQLDQIADTDVLAPAGDDSPADPDNSDYLSRLKALRSEGNG
jgi:copper chaperone NosL